jgi:hypothetical protein
VGHRTGLDDMEKRKFFPTRGLELRPLGRSAHSQSLCRLKTGPSDNIRYYQRCRCLVDYGCTSEEHTGIDEKHFKNDVMLQIILSAISGELALPTRAI